MLKYIFRSLNLNLTLLLNGVYEFFLIVDLDL